MQGYSKYFSIIKTISYYMCIIFITVAPDPCLKNGIIITDPIELWCKKLYMSNYLWCFIPFFEVEIWKLISFSSLSVRETLWPIPHSYCFVDVRLSFPGKKLQCIYLSLLNWDFDMVEAHCVIILFPEVSHGRFTRYLCYVHFMQLTLISKDLVWNSNTKSRTCFYIEAKWL
jgi:hypothetical protein